MCDAKKIESEIRQMRCDLIKRMDMQPPMCNRKTYSVLFLIDLCDKVLFLCRSRL